MLNASGDYAQLVECKIIALDTEKRPLVERVIKKFNLPWKRFFCPPSCLFYLASSIGNGGTSTFADFADPQKSFPDFQIRKKNFPIL